MNVWLNFLIDSLAFGAVFMYGSTGEILTEKAGHLNLGIPGIMCMGGAGGCLVLNMIAKSNLPGFLIVILGVAGALAMAMLMVFANCTSQRDKDLDAIHKYEGTIDFATSKVDIPTGETLVKMYVGFANNYPTDSLAPMYLMKAADVAMNIKRGDIAIKYLDRVVKDYPDYDKLADCYFMRGCVSETVLVNVNVESAQEMYEAAKEAYELFLMQYPNHPLAADTRTIIQNLSLSDEEIIKMIMEKNMAH